MDKSSQSRGRWLCQVCKKEKDLSGPHLNGKTSVRSDCWPCATKRQFDLVVEDNVGKASEDVQPSPDQTIDKGIPIAEKEAPKNTSSLFNGFQLSNKASETTMSQPDKAAGTTAPIVTKERENTSSIFKGFQFRNKASENDTSGFQKILQPENAVSKVNAVNESASKPEVTIDSEQFQWLCSHCRKAKDLSGPHLAGKHSVRSDCWPCATKREFIKTYVTPSNHLKEKVPEKVELPKPVTMNSTNVKADVSQTRPYPTNLSETDKNPVSREDKEPLPLKVTAFIDSLKTPEIPENFNPFESGKSGSVFSTKGSQKNDQKTSSTTAIESKPPLAVPTDSRVDLQSKQPSSIPSPFAPPPITQQPSKEEPKSSQHIAFQPSSAFSTSVTKPQQVPESTNICPSNHGGKDVGELVSRIEALEKRALISEQQNKKMLKKITQFDEQMQDFRQDIEERLSSEHNDVEDTFKHVTQVLRRLSDVYEEGFHDFAATIIRKMD